jgi:putative tryptophan/tyrosine transport system substrate-binding protein
MAEYAAEIVKSGPDLILATGPPIPALQEATKTIPILGLGIDLARLGLVNSMRKPNGNVTGVAFLAPELDGKRQGILLEIVPGIRQIAVLVDAKQADTTRLDALKEAAHARNIDPFIASLQVRRSRLQLMPRKPRALKRSMFWRPRLSSAFVK